MSGFTHERSIGGEVEWYTPPSVFKALRLTFDLDPCAPRGGLPWIPASESYWLPERDGLVLPWHGRVWMNPPWGRFTARWMGKFLDHGNGVALVAVRTGTAWSQRALAEADAVLFFARRLSYVAKNGVQGVTEPGERRGGSSQPGFNSMLIARGADNVTALIDSGLGVTMARPVTPL